MTDSRPLRVVPPTCASAALPSPRTAMRSPCCNCRSPLRHTLSLIHIFYVSAGQCDILVTRQILPYLLEQWDSAGRTKLHLSVIPLAEVQRPAVEKREIRDTVPSLRLDCLVGSAFSLARGPAGQLIAAGRVAVNDLVCLKGCLLYTSRCV